ncbi:MAG: hypothetical protein IH623_28600 [Verrucomicrobia bacterium]|nr:hypothetical protein [Verrucomicrobiota bacterium]
MIEYRLPLIQASHFASRVQEFDFDQEFPEIRRQIDKLIKEIKILEEYIDTFVSERTEKPHPNFRSGQQQLWGMVRKMKEQYSPAGCFSNALPPPSLLPKEKEDRSPLV